MKVVVTTETRFQRTPDGSVWTSGINGYRFWERYLAVFDGVKVVARVEDLPAVGSGHTPADGRGVSFVAVPNFVGPWQYLARSRPVHRAVQSAVEPGDAVVLRVSSHLAGCLEPALSRRRYPYGLEVVNDPWDVFAPGAVRHELRPFFRRWFTRQLRRQCKSAIGVAYVTEWTLQERYPAAYMTGMSDVEIAGDTVVDAPSVFTTHYSSVEFAGSEAVSSSRVDRTIPPEPRIVTVGSLAQMYKAPDILLRAIAQCIAAGLNVNLRIIGDGKHRAELERFAARLGIAGRVTFLGHLPAGAAVREQLDGSDLFVLPSRCEGLPRAMIEAMARALPCIGSTAGGIPELLSPEDLVPAGDAAALAAKIREVLASPGRMSRMSERNLRKAQEYRDDVLAGRRRAFYTHIRRATQSWVEARAGAQRSACRMGSVG